MNIDDLAIKSANTQRGGLVPSSTGLTPDALPEVQKNSFGRRRNQVFCLRQRKPSLSPFLLSVLPYQQKSRERATDCLQQSDRESSHYL